jgi:hypothetical protein
MEQMIKKPIKKRGKSLPIMQILESKIQVLKLRKELDKLSGVDYINYVIAIEKLKT